MFLIFFVAAVLIYLPALTTAFGIHTDYSLLLKQDKRNLLEFIEARHAVMIGRFLGAWLMSIQCWFAASIAVLSLHRIFFFFCFMGINAWLISFFHRKCRLDLFWSYAIVGMIFFLPGSQASILWTSFSTAGCLNLLLSIAVYYFFEHAKETFSRNIGSILKMTLAVVMLIALFFIYQPSTLFLTVLASSRIIFNERSQWPQTKKSALQDLVFLALGMIAYFLIDRFLVHPLALSMEHFYEPYQPEYQGGLVNNVFTKIPLLKEIITVSLAGTFHPLFGDGSSLLTPAIFMAGMIYLLVNRDKYCPSLRRESIEKFLLLAVLFLLSLASILAPQGYLKLTGYRVIHASSALIVVYLFSLLVFLTKNTTARWKTIGTGLAIVMIFASAIVTAINIRRVVKNASLELSLVQNALAQARPDTELYLLVRVPENRTLTGDPLKYEFAYMLTTFHHLAPIILEYDRNKKIQKDFRVAISDTAPLWSEPGVFVIDLKKHVKE